MPIGSQAAYARHAGITKQAVGKAVRTGRIPLLPDGQIDFDAADLARARNTDPARKPLDPRSEPTPETPPLPEMASGGLSFMDAKTAREAYQAKLSKLDYETKIGLLIPRREVEDAMVAAGRMIRQEMDGFADLADEVVSICAKEGGTAEVRQAIKARVTALQQKIADALARLGGEDDG